MLRGNREASEEALEQSTAPMSLHVDDMQMELIKAALKR
jgi:hypothetical protein